MATDAVILAELIRRSTPIGSAAIFPDSGPTINLDDGSEWLRTGLAKATTGYARAAALEHLKVTGIIVSGSFSIGITGMATDGAGNFAAAYGDGTNILVSTNGGVSWSTVAHNAGGAVHAVAYGASKWVAVGNSGIQWFAASCATVNGTWVVRTAPAITGGDAGSASMIFANSLFVAAGAGTTNAFMSSSDGITWTGATPATAITTNAIVAYANSKWLVGSTGSTNWQTSTNGTSWSNATGPLASLSGLMGGGGIFVSVHNGSYIYTSSDAVTWTLRNTIPGFMQGSGQRASYSFDGTRFIIGTEGTYALHWSLDGINWRVRWLSSNLNASRTYPFSDGTRMIVLGGSASSMYTTNFATADFVGTSYRNVTTGSTGDIYTPVSYVRIK